MRNRHLPRLCRDCQAPMAGHEDACWRCGAQWASEEAPRTMLRLIPAAAPSQPEHVPERSIVLSVGARSTNQVRLDPERWTNEDGTRRAVSATAFGSRLHAGSASGAEES